MSGTPTVTCPKCGNLDLLSVRWGYAILPLQGTLERDSVIFGGTQRPERAPDSACLGCHPEWAHVNELAIKEEVCQQNIETFVARAEFEPAVYWKEQRESVRDELRNRLKALLRDLD